MNGNIRFYTGLVRWDIILRLIFGPAIFLSPPVATVINLILDGFDGELFKRSGYARPAYSTYDKILDYWWYVWVMVYILVSGAPARNLFIALFVYRTAGQVLFLLFHRGILLFLFPNIFELVFFYYLLARMFGQEQLLFQGSNLTVSVLVLSIVAFAREIIIHLRKMNFSGVYLGKTSYWPQRTINPYKAFIFMSLILSGTFLLNQFVLIKQTETYSVRARNAKGSGTVLSYSPAGRLTGMVFAPVHAEQVYLFRNPGKFQRPVCRLKPSPLLPTDLGNRTVYLFGYTDSCLKDLPDGRYAVSAISREGTQKDTSVEFTIRNGSLAK